MAAGDAHAGFRLEELARELADFEPELTGDARVRVDDVEQDSRRVRAGALFVARRGAAHDGSRFVPSALERGARALLVSHDAELPAVSVPVLRVRDLSRALPIAAEAVHGHPARALSLVGVTGTNGKTTTTWLVQALLGAAGVRCARIGTLGYELAGEERATGLTTPEADELSRLLASARARSATHVAMEVSSVALSQRRVDGLSFAVAAFSNLTQDHLDFHGDLEGYGRAKARLFFELSPRVSVLNVDDPFGAWLARHAPGRVSTVSQGASADVSTAGVRVSPRGLSGSVRVGGVEHPLESPLVGAHNVENLGVALGVCAALELDVARVLRALPGLPPVPGRLERVSDAQDDCTVLVDYAHTPDALERVLKALRVGASGRLICVFGCGGDRDPTKRAPMGRAAGQGADYSVVTNDNPRTEPPEAILDAIAVDLQEVGARFERCAERALAIERALERAEPGDVVLIAGKGHETYQIVGTETLPFDDREQARAALARRRARREGR